jgi:hypothetical protein
MNEVPREPKMRPTPRLRWALAGFERLAELGVFTEEDRIELIGGELVPMQAGQYAALGVREYWVVNAATLETRVHRGPAAAGYGEIWPVAPNEPLAPSLIPSPS